MEIGSDQWKELIVSGAAQFGLTITAAQARAFALHARELVLWNKKINLTAIVEPRQLALKHFLDSVAPMSHIPSKGELIDVGTGGGFPGLPLSIMLPAQQMTLIDGSRKKITFIKHIVRLLGSDNVHALQTRSEDLGSAAGYRGRFQTIVCRAVAEPAAAVRMSAELLAPGGKIIVYQGPQSKAASAGRKNEWHRLGCRPEVIDYRLPFSDDLRKLVILHF